MENRHHPRHRVKILLILSMLLMLTGCPEGSNGTENKAGSFRVGEEIYVCGCPMMCCNSYSREPGRCICNVPLRKATVSRIHNGKTYVTVNGRVKSLHIPEK